MTAHRTIAAPPLENARRTAQRLGKSAGWFYRHVDRLIADEGFPAPVAGTRDWDPRAVDHWRAAQLPAGHPERPADPADALAAARAALRAGLVSTAG